MWQKSYSNHKFGNRNNFRKFHNRRGGFGNHGPKESIDPSKYINKATSTPISETYVSQHKFADFLIDSQLKENIIYKGYTVPTPIQDQTIPHILAGKDVVGIANTGTGKTAAFLIPLINKILQNRQEKVLIIIPTRELAAQIRDELRCFTRRLDIDSVLCIGGANIRSQMFILRQEPNIVIATPGRLKDLIQRRTINLSQFKNIVLDEVDRMLDIGFLKEIQYIISLLSKERQSLFFSATVSPSIHNLIQSFTKNPITISVKVSETAQQIDQDILHVRDRKEKLEKLSDMLRQQEFTKVLVFGRTKWGVEKLSIALQKFGFSAASIHGNKSQGQRIRAISLFKENRIQVLVATDVAARGLDIEDVSHVINYDEPASFDDYVHRIGRTGRANKQGKALTFIEGRFFPRE